MFGHWKARRMISYSFFVVIKAKPKFCPRFAYVNSLSPWTFVICYFDKPTRGLQQYIYVYIGRTFFYMGYQENSSFFKVKNPNGVSPYLFGGCYIMSLLSEARLSTQIDFASPLLGSLLS